MDARFGRRKKTRGFKLGLNALNSRCAFTINFISDLGQSHGLDARHVCVLLSVSRWT